MRIVPCKYIIYCCLVVITGEDSAHNCFVLFCLNVACFLRFLLSVEALCSRQAEEEADGQEVHC